jgi:NADH dehydrogenase
MSGLVTIFGGSGFVGRYIARRMAKLGWRVRVACRRPNEAMFVKTYGVVGQVEPVFCNIRDDASVAAVLQGATAVVNCVGTFDAGGKNSFENIQVDGADRIARLSTEAGVKRLVHLSSIGADETSASLYAQSKARGEAAVVAQFPGAVLLRPSVIFGPEDQFFNRFAGLSRFGPVLPVIGGNTMFQPVYVDDVAAAAEVALLGGCDAGVYELGGPDTESFRTLMERMLDVIHRKRVILNIPFWAARIMAFVFDIGATVSGGLLKNPAATRDQVRSLAVDNVVSDGARGFDTLGLRPTDMGVVLPQYLWRFRPSGQYDDIKASAKNLRS